MQEDTAAERAPMLALRFFARAKGIEEDIAFAIYEQECARLSRHARIARFVPVLAEKHTKEVLRISSR